MENIYDNGALMLGNIQKIIIEVEKEIKKDIDMFDINMEELLEDLKELKNIDNDMIVCIDYEHNGYMGYSINYWTSKDIIEKEEE